MSVVGDLGLGNSEAWVEGALCSQSDLELWFPNKGESGYRMKAAKKICADCPVQAQCLAYALKNNEQYGIWGGYSHRERCRIRRGEKIPPVGVCRHGHVVAEVGVDSQGKCSECRRRAVRGYQERRRAGLAARAGAPHGRTRYAEGCRCEVCTEANRDNCRRWRERQREEAS